MKEPIFIGSCTAMITPFNKDGIDLERFEEQLDYQISNGTSAVVIAGTTGEIATLSDSEYEALAVSAVEATQQKIKVIMGVGGNDTLRCLERALFARTIGADAILMTTPYYNKTSPAGLIEHFTYVADRVDIPMILYNVPSRTAISLTAEAYRKLASHPNINGAKEASGNFSLIAEIAASCSEQLWIWSGNDDHTIPMCALGAKGVISVASNIVPGAIAELCRLCMSGDYPTAIQLYRQYAPLMRALFIETNPIPFVSTKYYA